MLLKDDVGFVAPIPEWRVSCALVDAVPLDLSFNGRIDTDLEALHVVDPAPTGDEQVARSRRTGLKSLLRWDAGISRNGASAR